VLEGDLGERAVHVGDQRLLHDDVGLALLLPGRLDLGRQRREHRVRGEDADEGADQRRSDVVTEDLGRLVDRTHRLHDAEHRSADADRRERLGHRADRRIGLGLVLLDGGDFLLHQRLDFMRAGVADKDQAGVVADVVRQVAVLVDLRIVLEDRRLGRIVDVDFHLVARLGAQLAHQRVKQAKKGEVVGLLGPGALQGLNNTFAGVFDDRHRVCDDERAEGDSADDDVFERLPDDSDMATHRHKAPGHGADADNKAYENAHGFSPFPVRWAHHRARWLARG